MEISIRKYTSDDFDAVFSLIGLNIPASFDASEASDFKKYLRNELEDYFVAILNSKIVGCGGINYTDGGRTGIISWDMVHPNVQGKGVGSAILKHRLAVLKSESSIRKVIVRTSQTAFQFYEGHGFETVRIVKDFWAPGYDLVEMRHSAFY